LWIGTNGGGLNRLKDGKFVTYTTKEGLSDDDVRSIYEDVDGLLWIGTNGGLSSIEDGKLTIYTTKDGLSSNQIRAIYKSRDGSLWIGTENEGLNRFKNGKFTIYAIKDGLSSNKVRAIYEDKKGNLWIGTKGGGLNRLDFLQNSKVKFTSYTTKDGLSSDKIRVIHEDKKGNLWIGTENGGLNRLDFSQGSKIKFTTYTTKNGLSNDFIWSIYQDKDNLLWIGTSGGGLNRLDYSSEKSSDSVKKIISYTTKEGLFDDLIYQILEDNKENLWMSCDKGIFRVSKKELNDFVEGKVRSIISIPYGTADGMKIRECNGGSQPAGCKTKDGKLWFPTIKGVVVIDPENIKFNELLPPVIIEDVVVDGRHEKLNFLEKFNFSPGKEKFEFYYTALSFLVPERVKFKYKLEGFDKEWVDAGNRRTAYYTNIPPGEYSFKVIACNNDGIWNETGAEFNFYLKPHFYQTNLFYILCVMGFVFLGIGVYSFRVRQMRIRQKELEKLVEERTKNLETALKNLRDTEAQLVHSEKMASLGQLVAGLSHEINNPVNYIYSNMKSLEDYIKHFKKLLNEYENLASINQEEKSKILNLKSKILNLKSEIDYDYLIKDVDPLLKSFSEGIQKIKEIIINLKHFSRLDESELKNIDINESIESTLRLSLAQFENNLIVHKEYGNIPEIFCYARQINQVFMNLLVNSAQSIEERNKLEKRQKGNIWIKTEMVMRDEKLENSIPNSEIVRISIKDDGMGIPQNIRDKIFDPFFTTKPVGKGTGLGLSVSYGIIEKHKGRIYFNTEVNKGTEFIIELPVKN
jgi:signal transduction histidine kinase